MNSRGLGWEGPGFLPPLLSALEVLGGEGVQLCGTGGEEDMTARG